MFVQIWRMKGRKRKSEDYEKFGRQVTLPALKKIDGCLDAHFVRVFEARKPEYLWLVFWRDKASLVAARSNPAWRDQAKRFEAGKFYKTKPQALVCESLGSFAGASVDKLKKAARAEKVETRAEKVEKSAKTTKPEKVDTAELTEIVERAESDERQGKDSPRAFSATTAEGE